MSNTQYSRNVGSKPMARAGSFSKGPIPPVVSIEAGRINKRLTIAKFMTQYQKDFPVNFTVCKGFYGPNEDLRFSEGDQCQAHSLKQSAMINIEYENGARENIPAASSIPFAVLFDPHNNIKEAMKGYRFEKISELIQLPVLPPVLWSRKAYQGSSPDSSVSANELLIVRGVKSRLVGRQQLKVYSYTQRKEKTLYTTCVGSFSTKPRDVCLFLTDILKYMPDIFPCRAMMLNPEKGAPRVVPGGSPWGGACLVTLMHSSIDTSLVISSSLREGHQGKYWEIPIDLDILVRVESSEGKQGETVYEDASLFHQPTRPHLPSAQGSDQTQFYTNVHFGQGRLREEVSTHPPATFSSCESAVEQGHYQTPREVRTSSDPIAIDHPPDNYVLMTREPRGSLERSPASSEEGNSSSPSWRPPLPPPNKTKKERRSPGYDYVETNLARSTVVLNETFTASTRPEPSAAGRSLATESRDNGSVLSSSVPDSAYSEKSFGSSGSGGATVNHRTQQPSGSGDGLVERSMRCSSISSGGYSYAKTNPPHPHHLPPQHSNSPHHYNHLRSNSGPPSVPDPQTLTALIQQPVATTKLDDDSNSLEAIHRQQSTPAYSHISLNQPLPRPTTAPALIATNDPMSRHHTDSLSGVLDDLTKTMQELNMLDDEHIFTPDDFSPTSEAASSKVLEDPCDISSSSKQLQEQPQLTVEVIEKNKLWLKSMDNYQVLRLLEIMSLEQYTPTFKQEQINGDILSTCDDGILQEELKVSSRLHRMRLLRVIEGAYSVQEIMSGKDGYIFMQSAGKQ